MNRRLEALSLAYHAVGSLIVLAVLAFYVSRAFQPGLLFAADEGTYLIRALYPPDVIARNPLVPELTNSVYLSLVRGLTRLPGPDIVWLRLAGLAAYLGGLAAVFQVATRSMTASQRLSFLILALAFPYYRFVVTVLPEGAYVLAIGLIVALTARFYQARPVLHAILAGALCATLVLLKPHGLAVAASIVVLVIVDALVGGRWTQAPVRIALFAAAFFSFGVAWQTLTGTAFSNPLTFFMNPFYDRAIAIPAHPDGPAAGIQSLIAMAGAAMMLTGPAIVIALSAIISQRRAEPGGRLQGQDLAFGLLTLAFGATLLMVAIYAMKVVGMVSETGRLWGRYFEFFVPLIWLAAAPYLVVGALTRRMRLTCAAVALAGLAALLWSFADGVVLFPWDSTALTAFFAPDPLRAALPVRLPYRLLAVAATLAAILALVLRLGAVRAWTGYFLVLALLSTWLDEGWLGQLAAKHNAVTTEAAAAAAIVSGPGRDAVLVADGNDAHLGFLAFGGPKIMLSPPGAIPPYEIRNFDTMVVIAPATRMGAGWRLRYEGTQVSVFDKVPR